MTNHRRRSEGMAMVEMIFVLPILVLLVFAIAQFGLLFSRWQTLSNAVREGARHGVTFRGTVAQCNALSPSLASQVTDRVTTYAQSGGLVGINVSVQGTCGGLGTPLTVEATSAFDFQIPFVDPQDQVLRYASTMRNEF